MTSLLASRPRVDRSFERLYRRHVADVYHYALAVLRNPSDAEDVTQTTFLNAYSAYRRGERPQVPRNWLIAIAHNVCRQRFRQAARRPQEVALDQDIGETLVDDDAPSASDIQKALAHLAFNQRAALVMRELEGRNYAEIAEILGLSVAAVETVLFRARRALREQLEGALTCQQAELAVSRQLDGRLPRSERGTLRAHLRECTECATFARRQRAQRAALRSIATIPLPASLASFFGGGATVGSGVAAKAAAAVVVGALVGGAGYEGVKRLPLEKETASSVSARAPAGGVRAAPRPSAVAAADLARAGRRAALPHRAKAATAVAKARKSKGLAKGHTKRVDKPAAAGAAPRSGAKAPPWGGSKARKNAGSAKSHERTRTPPGQAKVRSKRKAAPPAGGVAVKPKKPVKQEPAGQAKKLLPVNPPPASAPPQPPHDQGGKK